MECPDSDRVRRGPSLTKAAVAFYDPVVEKVMVEAQVQKERMLVRSRSIVIATGTFSLEEEHA